MEEEKRISKFSSGLNILMRLDGLWKNCLNYKREGKYYKWCEELDSVWLELARDLKPEEYYDTDKKGEIIKDKKDGIEIKEGYFTKFKKFDEKLKKFLPFNDLGNIGFQQPNQAMNKNREKQYELLMEKQLFLARLENELGKGTSWDEEDDDF